MKKLLITCWLFVSLSLIGCNMLTETAVESMADEQQVLCDADAAHTAGQYDANSGVNMKDDYGHHCKNVGQIRAAYQRGYVTR